MKKLGTVLFILSLIFFQACQSTSVDIPLPGENSARIKNIYIEYMNIADEYFKLENYSKAVTYYKYAMKNKELYWTAYYKLAKTYAYQENWSEALTVYKVLLYRDPDNISLVASMAYIYAMTSQFDDAKKLYFELMEKNPDDSTYLENYISVLVAQGKIDEAKEQYEILKEKFPESTNIDKFQKEFDAIKKAEEDALKAKESQSLS
ncbi:MAG: tetratricopeptide repeat protein [Treponema sp.]|nr:tetratricopeptide repeat protein [Treponema sp.]